MSKRTYFGTAAPPITPAFDSSWEVTGAAVRRVLEVSKDDLPVALESLAASSGALNTPAQAVDVLVAQYVSAPLSGNQTISGAIKGQIRASESSLTGDLRAQTVIRVLSLDGTTVRGTLIASSASALASEFVGSLTNREFPIASPVSPSSVNALDTDRVVVEVGYRKHENAATNRSGTLSLGNPLGTDLAEDESTTTANTPWIEFADTLVFATTEERVSQVVVQSAITPPTVETRVSQVVVQSAIVPPASDSRVSLVVVQSAILQSDAVPIPPGGGARSWGTIIG